MGGTSKGEKQGRRIERAGNSAEEERKIKSEGHMKRAGIYDQCF